MIVMSNCSIAVGATVIIYRNAAASGSGLAVNVAQADKRDFLDMGYGPQED